MPNKIFSNQRQPNLIVAPTQSNNYTILSTDKGALIPFNTNISSLNLNLTDSVEDGFNFTVFNSGSNAVNVVPGSSAYVSRGTSLVNVDSTASFIYDEPNNTWYGIGDLS